MTRREMMTRNANIIRRSVRGKARTERHATLNALRFGVLSPAFFALMNAGGFSKHQQNAATENQGRAFG